jgi:hypothetical protein
MERHLNLIKTDFKETEKRVFPRFPFSYLTFKMNDDEKIFEVTDISHSGMQLSLKDGGHQYKEGETVNGTVHWRSASLKAKGKVQWVSGQRLGVSFEQSNSFEQEVKSFLSIDNIVAGMRPIHQTGMDLEVPTNLKYWIRADGPVEVFVWCHNDSEHSRFQVLMLDNFVEWEDGKGVKTGKVITKRDLDTPLITEDEFIFQIDEGVDMEKIKFAINIVEALPESYLPAETRDFIKVKMGA